jgi:putative inorganic carbon (HCO3(-)) transporter
VKPAAATAGAPPRDRTSRAILIAVLIAEAVLLLYGATSPSPLAGAAAAAALLYFLVAYRSPVLAWALVWIAIPFDVERLIGGGVAVTFPTEPMILIALLAWLTRVLQYGPGVLRPSRIHGALGALAAWALASSIWSVSPIATLKAWSMMFGYVAFGYLFCFQRGGNATRLERWLLLLAVMGAGWGAFGILRVLFVGEGAQTAASIASTYSFGAFRPFFSEHGTYAAYLGMLLPPVLIAALERRGPRRIFYALSTILMGSAIVLAFARAAWFAFVLVVPLTILLWGLWRRHRTRLLLPASLAVGTLLLVGALGVGQQITKHATSVVSTQNVSNLERLNRWRTATFMLRDRPLTGVGFGCYVVAYPAYRSKSLPTNQTYIRMGVHSEPLKLLSETGIPGFLAATWLLLVVFGAGLRVFVRSPDDVDRAIALAALASLATYVVNGFFNAYLAETKVTVPFWAAIGIIGALASKHRA